MIRLTFAAAPRRRSVIIAKAAIIAGLAFPAALASNLIAFLVGQQVLSAKHADLPLGHAGTARAIVLGAVAVSVIAVLGVGLGSLVKRTAAATTALSVAIVGSQVFGMAVPEGARKFLPGMALEAVVSSNGRSDLLTPVAGLMMLVVCTAVAMTLAMRAHHPSGRVTRCFRQRSHPQALDPRPTLARFTRPSTRSCAATTSRACRLP